MENLHAAAPVSPTVPVQSAASDTANDGGADSPATPFQVLLGSQVKLALTAATKSDKKGDVPDAATGDAAQQPAAMPSVLLPAFMALPPATALSPGAPPPLAKGTAQSAAALAAGAQPADRPQTPAQLQPAADYGQSPLDDVRKPIAMPHEPLTKHAAGESAMASESGIRGSEARQSRLEAPAANANTAQPDAGAIAHVLTERPHTAAAAVATARLDAPIGSPAWNTELGQSVVWMVSGQQHVAELSVNPPDLGPLEIHLTIDGQQTTAVFTSPHSAVREAVESSLPRLREVLAESGIMLGNASVTADSPRDGAAFSQQHQQPRAHHAFGNRGDDAASGAQQSRVAVVARDRGLVDLFA